VSTELDTRSLEEKLWGKRIDVFRPVISFVNGRHLNGRHLNPKFVSIYNFSLK
jgi:hypothetical protein